MAETTPIWGIHYDSGRDLALGRTQDQRQALTVENALNRLEGKVTGLIDFEREVREIDVNALRDKLTQRDELQVTTTGTGVWTVQDGLGNPLPVNTDGSGRWTIGA